MGDDHFHQPLSQTLPLKRVEDEHIRDPRERCIVRYHSRKADLLIAFVDAERKRVFD